MHLTYVASSKTVNWCMFVWCTQHLCWDSNSFTQHQQCQKLNSAATTLVDIQSAKRCVTVTHSELHTPWAQWVCCDAENSAIVAYVKRFRSQDEAFDKCSFFFFKRWISHHHWMCACLLWRPCSESIGLSLCWNVVSLLAKHCGCSSSFSHRRPEHRKG